MIILPPPWEGLHPAFPRRPDPFNTSSLCNATVAGGVLGALWFTGALLFRRSPHSSLRVAAYATVASTVINVGSEQLVGKLYARPYLESKGIAVPRQKLVTRTLHLDEDSFIVAGGVGAVLLARSVARPWQVTGWKRIVGAFSMGTVIGSAANYAYNWRHIRPCAEIVQRQKVQRALYDDEVKVFKQTQAAARYNITIETGTNPEAMATAAAASAIAGQPGPGTSMQQFIKDLQKQAEDNMENMAATDAHKLDEQDPQPHYSELRDGERVFRPDPNYSWSGSPEALDTHITALRERRERLKQEAELLWHKMAVREASYHSANRADDDARITLEVMNHLHINAYLEISQLDWMISSSQKRKLQLDQKRPWVPSPPENAERLVPKHTLLLLEELERDNRISLEELEMMKQHTQMVLQDPALEAVDKFTGMRVEDPYEAARKDLVELERGLAEGRVMKDAIKELRKELGGEDK